MMTSFKIFPLVAVCSLTYACSPEGPAQPTAVEEPSETIVLGTPAEPGEPIVFGTFEGTSQPAVIEGFEVLIPAGGDVADLRYCVKTTVGRDGKKHTEILHWSWTGCADRRFKDTCAGECTGGGSCTAKGPKCAR